MNNKYASTTAIAALILSAPTAIATNVQGSINTDTTWTLANSPYVVVGTVRIQNLATLTIEPGVEVRFQADRALFVGQAADPNPTTGTLKAIGTSAQPIVFTSDAAQSPGAWRNIVFERIAVDAAFDDNGAYVSGSTLQHCIVLYGGGYGGVVEQQGGVVCHQSAPYISNCVFEHNARPGVYAELSSTAPYETLRIVDSTFRSNSIPGNAGGGLRINAGRGHVVQGCRFEDHDGVDGRGAAITNATDVEVSDCAFMRNVSNNHAGGLYLAGCTRLTMRDNMIRNNRAAGVGGGAYMSGCDNALVESTTLWGNESTNYRGGGLEIVGSGLILRNCTIIANRANAEAYEGGGLWAAGPIRVESCVFAGNSAFYAGSCAFFGGPVTFVNNLVVANTASSDVGGLYFLNYGGHQVQDNVILANHATNGIGGVGIFNCPNSLLLNNRILGNVTGGFGGGVRTNVNLRIQGNEIVGNTGGWGGGVFLESGSHDANLLGTALEHNTIAHNTATRGAAIYNGNGLNGGVGNVDARYVNWGTNVESEIQAGIWDFYDDSSLGEVVYFPSILNQPVTVAGCPGDFNLDGNVEIADLSILLSAFAACPGESTYNVLAGILSETDACVTLEDLAQLLSNFGTVCD